ncbi:MAG: hypothetical protein Q8O53_00865 [Candidatus Moranbacteria bacterium]|nr:hypothetical protein [Candidatus Moranbacteria bacterium]
MNDTVRTLSVGQALEVQDALRRQGLPLSFLKNVTSGTWFLQLNEVMEGRAEIIPTAPVLVDTFRVDYSIKAAYPDWMRARMHPEFDRVDTVEHRFDQVKRWLHPTQECDREISGNQLYHYIKKNKILPTCLALRDLEEIQKLGIEAFRKHFGDNTVFAWKDVVQSRRVDQFVPYLVEHVDQVILRWHWLGRNWYHSSSAARFAS